MTLEGTLASNGASNAVLGRTFHQAPSELFLPWLINPLSATASNAWPAANRMYGVRYIAQKTGTLVDLSVFVVTQSGNLDVGVYDTGDTVTTTRTKLYSSGSTAVGAGGWQSFTPNLAVVQGRHYDVAVAIDNTTAAIVRLTNTSTVGYPSLPTGYLSVPGAALAKLAWQTSTSFPLPASVTEANAAATQIQPFVLGRIA